MGGALLGLGSVVILLYQGRVAGMSGIFAGVLMPRRGDLAWRALFVAGLIMAGVIAVLIQDGAFTYGLFRTPMAVALSGLLVGFGTRMGSGCTSGHGICGFSRLSVRSIVATLTFMGSGGVTVFMINRFLGGSI